MALTDAEFFTVLLDAWKTTTRAAESYWEPKRHGDTFSVYAVGRDDSRTLVAVGLSEADAEWLCGVHGCMPEVVRRLRQAVDEADRLDRERDEREQLIADLSRQLDVKGAS